MADIHIDAGARARPTGGIRRFLDLLLWPVHAYRAFLARDAALTASLRERGICTMCAADPADASDGMCADCRANERAAP